MPLKRDGNKRWVEMEFVTPGTPEQVWQAMATGPGNAAWFTRAVIEERVGGKMGFIFAPGAETSGEVTIWEPPRRFGYVERGWNGDAPAVDTEIEFKARPDGKTQVRMIHVIVSESGEWDGQLESFEAGWPGFFEVLRIYLGNFAGKPAASFQFFAPTTGESLAVWRRLTESLQLANPNVDEKRSTPPGPDALAGTVERVLQEAKMRVIMLRLDAPMAGIALTGCYGMPQGINTSISVYFYGEQAAATVERLAPLWEKRMKGIFPPLPAAENKEGSAKS